MKRFKWSRREAGSFVGPILTAVSLTVAQPVVADSPAALRSAVNFRVNGEVTGGVPMTVDVGKATQIGDGVEYQGFAFGTYDVDATVQGITMTLATDPTQLKIGTYDASTKDLYYYEFDRPVTSAVVSGATEGFNATATVLSPGEVISSHGSFAPGLATSFMFPQGGVLIAIGEGSALRTVGTGGSLRVDLTFD